MRTKERMKLVNTLGGGLLELPTCSLTLFEMDVKQGIVDKCLLVTNFIRLAERQEVT